MGKIKKLDLIGQIAEKSKKLNSTNTSANTETNTETNTSIELESGTDTKLDTDTKLNTSNNTKLETNINHNTKSNTATNISTNTSTDKKSSNGQLYKRKKERIEKVQRAYYFTIDIINSLEKFCKKNKVDKSEIVNEALTEFLEKYQ